MMRLRDATKLASTKLRTRRVRLTVTIVIAGLLFSGLAAASQVSRGAFSSIQSFNSEGFGKRYIVTAFPQSQSNVNPFDDQTVIDRALAIEKDQQAKKVIEAKRLGIEYNPKNDRPVIMEFDTPQGKQKQLDISNPLARQAMSEFFAAHKPVGLPELEAAAKPYGAEHFYSSRMLSYGPDAPNLAVLKDGKENYDLNQSSKQSAPTGTDTFTQQWSLMSRDLFTPFMLKGASSTIGTDGSIPVVAPYTAVEQLLKLKALSPTASPAERLERLKEVRATAKTITFQVCYRNQDSSTLLSQAISTQQELLKNKDVKDYQKPSLIYNLPAKPCGSAVVSSDTRTKAEKDLAAKRIQFDQLFGEKPAVQEIMTFRVIGIAPDPPAQNAAAITSLISSLLGSSLGAGTWYTPIEVQDKVPLLGTIFAPSDLSYGAPDSSYTEFSTAASAKKFIAEQNCQPDFPNGPVPSASGTQINPFEACQKQGKFFSYQPFGSNSLALEDAEKGFSKIFTLAALAVAAVAAVIMVGTVGRTVADSRRETAVFRAIGAKKFDIVQIYILYTIFLSLLIFAFATLAGFGVAQFIDHRYAAEFTVQSLVAYNAQDLTKTFNLYSFYWPDMLRLLGLSLAGGLLSALFPLFRNLRRNPIRDMRDET